MGGFGWQDALVALAAVAALGWLIRRRLTRKRSTPFCDDCPACHAARDGASAVPPRRHAILIHESELTRK